MFPSEICLDANVFVSSLVRKEEHYSDALQTVETVQRRGMAIFEPEIVLFEFGTAIHRKRTTGEIDDEDTDDLIGHFFRLPILFLWEASLMQRASSLAQNLSFKGISDCLYLAVAEKKNIPFVTFDGELLKKGRKIFSKIYSVTEFLASVSQ